MKKFLIYIYAVYNRRKSIISVKKELKFHSEISNPVKYLLNNKQSEFEYSYSKTSNTPVIYSLIYAITLNHLSGEEFGSKKELLNYINSFQSEEYGLFKDEKLVNDLSDRIDWWGWRHLSAHVITAITALRGKTKYHFKFVDFLYGKGNTRKWLESLNWTNDAANTSNAVMNYGVCLQYNREFWYINEAKDSLLEMFDFLDEIQDEKTGLWGGPFDNCQNELSLMEQTAYHLWALYFYVGRRISYIEKAIDSCLALQNELGGFGPGCEASRISNPFTSACEDIDCIDPLSRFYFMTDYRKKDIEDALRKAIPWILTNQNDDGGFLFRRDEIFVYGHELMTSQKNESNMFATWFRTLSLAYISKVLSNENVFKKIKFNLNVNCPGYQFWKPCNGN